MTPRHSPPTRSSTVAGVPGVADAVANIESADSAVRPVRPDGENILTNGPPILAFNWIDNEQLSPFTLVDGAPPQVGQFTMDVDSAAKYGFVDRRHVPPRHPKWQRRSHPVGHVQFGADNSTLGAVLMQMNTAEASELFGIDGITNVAVQVADGANVADVQAAIAAAVPTAEVVDHATVLAEKTSEFTTAIDLVGNILLGFGAVAVFVSIFIIYNTFAIVMSQRSHELALLRTVGADPRQIRRSVLGEAFVVGVLASVGGIAGGIAVAKGIALAVRRDRRAPHRLPADPRTHDADRRGHDRHRCHDGRRDRTVLVAHATVAPIAILTGGTDCRRRRLSHPQDLRRRSVRRRPGLRSRSV